MKKGDWVYIIKNRYCGRVVKCVGFIKEVDIAELYIVHQPGDDFSGKYLFHYRQLEDLLKIDINNKLIRLVIGV